MMLSNSFFSDLFSLVSLFCCVINRVEKNKIKFEASRNKFGNGPKLEPFPERGKDRELFRPSDKNANVIKVN